jgi:prolyl-tRNA editing enzyme YbaK/EbsC (Cys-tRNA(Pro) deacylase)
MSLESVRTFLHAHAPDVQIVRLEREHTTAVISREWDVLPAQVAKTLLLRRGSEWVMAVTCGDRRLDNRKCKDVFGGKTKMAGPEDAEAVTGHPVGGVCPLGLRTPLAVYFDIALKQYAEVVPGAGSKTHAFRIAPSRLATLANAQWVDICG